MTPQEHTQRIIDDICARHRVTPERLLRRPDPAEYGSEQFKSHVRFLRAELAWRLRHEKTPKTAPERIAIIMNCSKRSVFHLVALWADQVEWRAKVERLAA